MGVASAWSPSSRPASLNLDLLLLCLMFFKLVLAAVSVGEAAAGSPS